MTLTLRFVDKTPAADRALQRAVDAIEREVGDFNPEMRRRVTRILGEFKADLEAMEGSFW